MRVEWSTSCYIRDPPTRPYRECGLSTALLRVAGMVPIEYKVMPLVKLGTREEQARFQVPSFGV